MKKPQRAKFANRRRSKLTSTPNLDKSAIKRLFFNIKTTKKAVKKICAVNILTIKQMCSIFKQKNEVSHGQKGSHR